MISSALLIFFPLSFTYWVVFISAHNPPFCSSYFFPLNMRGEKASLGAWLLVGVNPPRSLFWKWFCLVSTKSETSSEPYHFHLLLYNPVQCTQCKDPSDRSTFTGCSSCKPPQGDSCNTSLKKEIGRKCQAGEFVWKLLHTIVQRLGSYGLALFWGSEFGFCGPKLKTSFHVWALHGVGRTPGVALVVVAHGLMFRAGPSEALWGGC